MYFIRSLLTSWSMRRQIGSDEIDSPAPASGRIFDPAAHGRIRPATLMENRSAPGVRRRCGGRHVRDLTPGCCDSVATLGGKPLQVRPTGQEMASSAHTFVW